MPPNSPPFGPAETIWSENDAQRLRPGDKELWESECRRVYYGGQRFYAILPGDPPKLAVILRELPQ